MELKFKKAEYEENYFLILCHCSQSHLIKQLQHQQNEGDELSISANLTFNT